MSRIEDMIRDLCPDGVRWVKLGEVCEVLTGGEAPEGSIKGKEPQGDCIYPIYSNGVGDNSLWGYAPTYRVDRVSVTFSSIGTIGCPTIRDCCYTPIIRLKVLYPLDESILNVYYLKYALEIVEFGQQKSSVPNINANMIKAISFPLPPLPIQEKIVEILEKFSLLSAELEAELEGRRKQYDFYRNRLLSFDSGSDSVQWKTLGEVCEIIKAGGDVPTNTIKGQLFATSSHPYPVYSNGTGENALYGFADTYTIEDSAVTISARGTIGWHTVRNGMFTPIVRLITLVPNIKIVSVKYLNYALSTIDIVGSKGGVPQLTIPDVKQITIPVPSLANQERIVRILDKFEALVTDLSSGLPAEIERVQKQYEYYRNKLLTF